jgi:hypothetical protein
MMTRVLAVCLLAVVLVQPSTAGAGLSGVDQRALPRHGLDAAHRADADDAAPSGGRGCDVNQSGAGCPRIEGIRGDISARVDTYTRLSHMDGRSIWSNVVALNNAGNTVSQCSQALALGPDVPCVHACDASKESCESKCSAGRTACLAQCVGLGFACEYYCHASFYVCRGNCSKTHDACVGNCPARGGEKQ